MLLDIPVIGIGAMLLFFAYDELAEGRKRNRWVWKFLWFFFVIGSAKVLLVDGVSPLFLAEVCAWTTAWGLLGMAVEHLMHKRRVKKLKETLQRSLGELQRRDDQER